MKNTSIFFLSRHNTRLWQSFTSHHVQQSVSRDEDFLDCNEALFISEQCRARFFATLRRDLEVLAGGAGVFDYSLVVAIQRGHNSGAGCHVPFAFFQGWNRGCALFPRALTLT